MLFSGYLNHNAPVPRPIVKIKQDDLLPGPQGHFSLHDGYVEGWPHHSRTNMGITIPVSPSLVVFVMAIFRGYFPYGIFQIADCPAFKLDCGEGCGRARNKQGDGAVLHRRFFDQHLDLRRKIDNVSPSGGLNENMGLHLNPLKNYY